MMGVGSAVLLLCVALACLNLVRETFAIYVPLREYAGPTFFDEWAYYGNVDNTTWGNVTFVAKDTAVQKRLTYVNDAGNAIVKVDDQSTVLPDVLVHRDTIRLTSLHSYGIGTLIVIDAIHIPYGCSVWPSFWTYGLQAEWPNAGEIDIIEGINGMGNNQVALHALGGCVKTETAGMQTGRTLEGDCAKPQGCIVAETKPNSFGEGFAKAGGGAFALQIEESGIFSWFWSRPDIPSELQNGEFNSQQINTSAWGVPTASYPANTCNIARFFPPQNLVLLTTLCGVWAGNPSIYQQTCTTPTNSCVADNVIGTGDKFKTAFWEIKYIRTYNNVNTTTGSPGSASSPNQPATTTSRVVTGPTSLTAPGDTQQSAALQQMVCQVLLLTCFLLGLGLL